MRFDPAATHSRTATAASYWLRMSPAYSPGPDRHRNDETFEARTRWELAAHGASSWSLHPSPGAAGKASPSTARTAVFRPKFPATPAPSQAPRAPLCHAVRASGGRKGSPSTWFAEQGGRGHSRASLGASPGSAACKQNLGRQLRPARAPLPVTSGDTPRPAFASSLPP